MAVGPTRGFIFPLSGLFLHPAGCLVTLLTSETGGGASLVADHVTMQQVVLGYMVPVALLQLKRGPKVTVFNFKSSKQVFLMCNVIN